MSRLARPASRLATGSALLARRLAARAAAWCARGRRDDLTGWRATLGIIVRLALLIFGAYLLARIVRALPALMWLLSTGWTIASWRAGRPAAEEAEEEPEEGPVEPPAQASGEALRSLLLTLMGTGSAVHLSTVLAHLQRQPDTAALTASWEIADLRSRLEDLGIPVHPKVKASGKGPTRGVRREDLAASPATAPEASPAASTAA
ncbi:hypothetical protein ACFYQA_08340 [Streptomyces sp. NPDC005774]|uniref:hypothetical protein n=1 Tax=Streptomyces sp. NPDC005774 TaxID=3364728 RepID=UPI0036D10A08